MNSHLLASVSRSFYLSMRFLPREMRMPVSLAYLLARTSDTIADTAPFAFSTRLATLNEFNHAIQYETTALPLRREFANDWAPAQANPAESSLLQNFGEILDEYLAMPEKQKALIRSVLSEIVKGQLMDISLFGPAEESSSLAICLPNAAELKQYTWCVAGCVGVFWSDLGELLFGETFSSFPPDKLREIGANFGQSLQLINILRDLHEDLSRGRCYLPCGKQTIERENAISQLKTFANHWLQEAEVGMLDGLAYADSLSIKSLRFATALPAQIGLETISAMTKQNWLELPEKKVKISRNQVRQQLWKTFLFAWKLKRYSPPKISSSPLER